MLMRSWVGFLLVALSACFTPVDELPRDSQTRVTECKGAACPRGECRDCPADAGNTPEEALEAYACAKATRCDGYGKTYRITGGDDVCEQDGAYCISLTPMDGGLEHWFVECAAGEATKARCSRGCDASGCLPGQ
jgi:hypothetical protein